MAWASIKARSWFPERGSEGGVVVLDEEHSEGARITLERKARSAPFAVTCGIYGWMVHTRFFSDAERAHQAVKDMKRDIEAILASIPVRSEATDERMAATSDAIRAFVDRYPT